MGVMKRAVKWMSMSVDHQPDRKEQNGQRRPVEKGSGQRRPAIKEQDGRHRLRKQQWLTSMAFFMTHFG